LLRDNATFIFSKPLIFPFSGRISKNPFLADDYIIIGICMPNFSQIRPWFELCVDRSVSQLNVLYNIQIYRSRNDWKENLLMTTVRPHRYDCVECCRWNAPRSIITFLNPNIEHGSRHREIKETIFLSFDRCSTTSTTIKKYNIIVVTAWRAVVQLFIRVCDAIIMCDEKNK